MDMVSNENNNNEGQIQTILEMLKKQIDHYDTTKRGDPKSKAELTRDQRIQNLIMEEKQLSAQFEQIKKELKRYERKYEKALNRKVKLMRMQIAENKQKLEATKQKYFELDTELVPLKLKRAEKKSNRTKSKRTKTILKVRTMPPKFKQKDKTSNKKIKIKIKNNVKLNKREMHFVNDVNGQSAFKNLIRRAPLVEPTAANVRECRIMLQRLTEKQMNKHVDQKRLDQSQIGKGRVTCDSSQKINEVNTIFPNWQIKIPKSVFEESQKENRKYDLNMASTSKDVI